MKSAYKLFSSVFLVLTLFFVFPTSAFATLSSKDYGAAQNTDFTVYMNLPQAGLCAGGFAVDKITHDQTDKCLWKDPTTGDLSLVDQIPGGGLIGGLGTTMVALYTTPPLSTTQYLADMGENLGIVDHAYAASVSGAGAGVIQPILKVWTYIRDIAYLAFIIIFIVVGFMVMFRQKINPQTVISVQAALPGLVMGLILVTFSYFISAFLIDLSFLGMHLVAGVFTSLADQGAQNIAGQASDINKLATTGSIWNLFGTFIFNGNNFSSLAGPIKDAFQAIFPGLNPNNPVGFLVGGALGGILGLIGILIIMIALVIAMFKLLWELVNAYITILITTVISPLIILWSSFPGKSGALDGWWKTIVANALVFPTVFGAFLFAGLFLGSTNTSDFQTTLPLFQGIPVELFRTLLGYGILLAAPGMPKLVKDAFKVKENPLGSVAQAGFAAGYAPVAGTMGVGSRFGVNTAYDMGSSKMGGHGPLSETAHPRIRATAERLLRGQRWFRG